MHIFLFMHYYPKRSISPGIIACQHSVKVDFTCWPLNVTTTRVDQVFLSPSLGLFNPIPSSSVLFKSGSIWIRPLSVRFHLVQASFSLVPSSSTAWRALVHYLTCLASVDPVNQVRLGSLAQLSKPAKIGQTWPNPSTHLS